MWQAQEGRPDGEGPLVFCDEDLESKMNQQTVLKNYRAKGSEEGVSFLNSDQGASGRRIDAGDTR